MNKKHLKYILCLSLLIVMFASSAQAAWKTTSAGRIYTCKSAPGYYTGWHTIKKAKYYFKKNGVAVTGWKTIKKKVYYFDSKGRMVTGLASIGDAVYYFGSDGVRRTGFQKIKTDGRALTYYFDENGVMARNAFLAVNNQKYYVNENGILQYGYFSVGGKNYYAAEKTGQLACKTWVSNIYYFKADCTMAVNEWANGRWFGPDGKFTGAVNLVGFIVEGNSTYYYSSNHQPMTGFLTISGVTYYFAPAMQTGWFSVGNYRFLADENGAVQKNVWSGKKYLLAGGNMAVGWQTINGKRYYFSEKGNYKTGMKTIDGKRYVFESDGVLKTNQWYVDKKKRKYFLGSDGAALIGFQKIGEKLYYFDPATGEMKTKMFKVDGKRYYAHSTKGILYQNRWFRKNDYKYYATADGSLQTGLMTINQKIYCFTASGKMVHGKRRKVDGKYYYFTSDGSALIASWKKISGKRYYFGADGVMAVNTVVDGYEVSATGERLGKVPGGWQTKDGKKYYVVAGQAQTGLQVIDGNTYYFDETGAMQTGLQTVGEKKYYFYSYGAMAKNLTIAVGDKQYTLNDKGVVIAEETIKIAGNTKGSKIAKYAIKFIGNPYVYGGTSLTNGADCSGFVLSVMAQYGITVPRVADDQMHGKGVVVPSFKDMLPGDLVFYGSGNYASHVAIYIGDGNIVHASNSQPYPAGGIKISNYDYSTPIRVMRYWS